MADSNSNNTEKSSETIRLRNLNPQIYRAWASAVKATLKVYNCWDLVTGVETKPGPPASPDSIAEWETRNDIALNALMNALSDSELVKVHHLENANEVWTRLHDEFGTISTDLLYANATHDIYVLRKLATTSMRDHINQFTRLVDERNFQAPEGTPALPDSLVNLAFLRSLGPDWFGFYLSVSLSSHTFRPGEVYAQAMELEMATSVDNPVQQSTIQTQPQHPIDTLSLEPRLSDGSRFKGRFKPYHSKPNQHRFRENSGGHRNENGPFCVYCKRKGHTRDQCFRRPNNGGKVNGNDN
jgi:hypothetical protein